MQENEVWVFLSHSNKDYDKVRQVRNLLEEENFRPLMFFLNCLNDDDEIDELIKREIDSRKRFILCDSKNAQSSKWVKKEVEYIKSKDRIYQKINIDAPITDIAKEVLDFKLKSSVCVCSLADNRKFSNSLVQELRKWDFFSVEIEFKELKSTLQSSFVLVPINDDIVPGMMTRLIDIYNILSDTEKDRLILYTETYYNAGTYRSGYHHSYNSELEYIKDSVNRKWSYSTDYESRAYNIVYYLAFYDARIRADAYNYKSAEMYYREGLRLYMDDRPFEGIEQGAYCLLRKAASMGHQHARDLIEETGYWTINKEETWNQYIEETEKEPITPWIKIISK